jgi:hypothetical protein
MTHLPRIHTGLQLPFRTTWRVHGEVRVCGLSEGEGPSPAAHAVATPGELFATPLD